MTFELALTPSGRIVAHDDGKAHDAPAGGRTAEILKAFASSPPEGLFTLAAGKLDPNAPASFTFWRDFAARYLSDLCQTPEGADVRNVEISPPAPAELASLLLSLPPMPGAEYLTHDRLKEMWCDLDDWVRSQVSSANCGLSGFLADRAPLWHQVGRVCFHLAENRRDPDYPFAFLATYAPTLSGTGRIQYQPLSKALERSAGAKDKQALIKLLSPVNSAAEASPLVRELVDSGDVYQPLAWTPQQAYRFLKEVPLFEQSGIVVRLPDWWKSRPRPRVGMTIGEKKQTKFGVDGLLDFQVRVALGDQELTAAELRKLLNGDDGLVLIRGQWVEVDRNKLTEALEHWKVVERHAGEGLSFIDGMRLLAGAPQELGDGDEQSFADREWSFVDAGTWLGQTLAGLRNPHELDSPVAGNGLKATLRPYQKIGVGWLYFLSNLGLGACLADDMGLGKTIQVLGLLLALKKKRKTAGKPSLLVLPASLLANWQAEFARFAPDLRVRFVHPSLSTRSDLTKWADSPSLLCQSADVLVTTYGMLQRQKWLHDVRWRLVILDEAQAIKNPSARQTKAVKRFHAESRIALTGTPVENRIGDLWSLFDFLCPGLLGSPATFKKFVKNLGDRQNDRYAPLRRLVSPYILRRLKTDKSVIADLPEKTEVRAFCGLSKRQAALYSKLVAELSGALTELEGIKRRGLVLAYLMRFKQLCNHPSQLLGDGEFAPKDSGKFRRLEELCDEIAQRQEKALVFTQFREMTEPLSNHLAHTFGRKGLVLHGGTPVKRRRELIDDFQRDDGPPFFVLSLKAGGTGLNLTAASHVIHFDRWWNPAVENQATDRAFRIGQKRNVVVHKFVCQGTVEEKIDALIQDKSQLASDLIEGGAEAALTEMPDDELIRLVSLDVNRIEL